MELEGSVDLIIYRDCIVNRRFLFTVVWPKAREPVSEAVKVSASKQTYLGSTFPAHPAFKICDGHRHVTLPALAVHLPDPMTFEL